jgi:hypothetical protein
MALQKWRSNMTIPKWHLEGKYVEYCSCDHGCPCEAMAPPTQGHCDGLVMFEVDEGYYGDVRLDNVQFGATYFFPRAIHHGGGHMQPIISDTTTEEQRDAIFTILSGEEQPAGTIFNIFSIIVDTIHEPQFVPIGFEWDIKRRTCKVDFPGIAKAETGPILNPVTDGEVQIRTVLPDGWVFYEAENGSGKAKGVGDIKFDYSQRHSSLSYFAFNNDGMAYSYEEAKARYGLDNAA